MATAGALAALDDERQTVAAGVASEPSGALPCVTCAVL